MDRIQTQASDLWDLLFNEETADTYQKALNLTGTILKESAQLVWLIICSVFVFGAWFADASTKTGKGVRDWVDNRGAIAPSPEAAKISATQKGKSLLDTGRESVAAALNKARVELGLNPNAPLATPRENSPVAKLVTPSAEPASSSTASSSVASGTTDSSTTDSSATAQTSTAAITASNPTSTESSSSTSPSAGAATARPATSEGQNIGSDYASSRGSGSSASGLDKSAFADKAPGSQSGGPQSNKYDSQDFDEDSEDDDESADSSWPPQTADD